MKTLKNILVIALAIPSIAFSQTEDFSDGDFTNNPTWVGETANFIVASGKLQLNAPAVSGSSYLSVPVSVTNSDTLEWRTEVNMDFNSSGTSYSEIWIMASSSDLKTANGYFVRVGHTADNVVLFKRTGGSDVPVITGGDKTLDKDPAEAFIKVVKQGNNFTLYLDAFKTGKFSLEGTGSDATYSLNTFHTGVVCIYTSSRSKLFTFDNFFVGKEYIEPPVVRKSGEIIANPQIFDPNSGNPDKNKTQITYVVDTTGVQSVIANLFIFNSRGQMINHLEINKDVFSEPTGSFIWNGTNQNGVNVPIGIYTLVLEYIDNKGGYGKLKAAVAIGTTIQ